MTVQPGIRPGADQVDGAPPGVPVKVVGTRRRRVPGLAWLAVALIAAGALGEWGLYAAAGDRAPVVALVQAVPYGQEITGQDLRAAALPGDTGLAVVAWEQRDALIGRLAATDLRAGQLATPDSVMSESLPGEGDSIVGVPVKAGQLPATPLQPRDQVLIVSVGAAPYAGGAAVAVAGGSVEATVLRVGPVDGTGLRVVDVLVPRGDAEMVAQLAGAGQAVLVIVARS